MTSIASQTLTVAVAGNPNSGKTTIFNNLTGARQRVGNYPGVTVEWKEGSCKRGDLTLKLVDLPGTYSLNPFSEEELVARDFVLNRAPDVVVNVVDASNLERNLFLTTIARGRMARVTALCQALARPWLTDSGDSEGKEGA